MGPYPRVAKSKVCKDLHTIVETVAKNRKGMKYLHPEHQWFKGFRGSSRPQADDAAMSENEIASSAFGFIAMTGNVDPSFI
jgi:hypothetical protein